jgi:hypothetical protein
MTQAERAGRAVDLRFEASEALLSICAGAVCITFIPDDGLGVGRALHDTYNSVVQEPVPDDLKDLLDKLD